MVSGAHASIASRGRQRVRANALGPIFVGALSLAVALPAVAGSGTGSIAVAAIVNKNCIVAATPLNFGTYVPKGGALKVNSTVNVNCTKGTPFTVALNVGTTPGTTFAQRLLQNGTTGDSDTLQYNLYTSTSYASIWGDGTSGTSTVAGTGVGALTSVAETVYGQLVDSVANQNVSPGTYTDTITVTVTF
jgi:spore coat protein U-like protein